MVYPFVWQVRPPSDDLLYVLVLFVCLFVLYRTGFLSLFATLSMADATPSDDLLFDFVCFIPRFICLFFYTWFLCLFGTLSLECTQCVNE
jgi:hypothetical protein